MLTNPTQWIAERIGQVVPVRPPMLYVAHPVAAVDGEVIATCTECDATNTFAPGDSVDLRLICDHDAPVRHCQDAPAIVRFNIARALRWWRWFHIGLPAATFVMPWYVNVTANGEANPLLIERGLRDDCEVVKRCDALVLCGPRVSSGMRLEAETALDHGLDVFHVPGVGREPSRHSCASVPWRRWQP